MIGNGTNIQRIEGVGLVLAPLRNNGEFSWYDVPLEKMLARFSMVWL
jgi:hypothetical protein